MRALLRYIVFFFTLSCWVSVAAQTPQPAVQVKAYLDSAKIKIGEQVQLHLCVSAPASTKNLLITWPSLGDTLRKEVEIVTHGEIDTMTNEKQFPNAVMYEQVLTLTSFDSGYWAIQPFVFTVNNDTTQRYETEALLLQVNTVPTDTSMASIRDIRTVYTEKFDWNVYLPYVALFLAIILLSMLITIWVVRRKKKMPVVIPEIPKEEAHIYAFRELDRIEQEKIWKEGKVKMYYTDLTHVLRTYMEMRYRVHAMELTSVEILTLMKHRNLEVRQYEQLQQILHLADYVKFAKMETLEAENELCLDLSRQFVEGTYIREQTKDKLEEEQV